MLLLFCFVFVFAFNFSFFPGAGLTSGFSFFYFIFSITRQFVSSLLHIARRVRLLWDNVQQHKTTAVSVIPSHTEHSAFVCVMMSRSSDNTSTISLLACSIIPPPLFWNRSIFRHKIIDLTHVCFDVPTQTPLSWAYFLKNKVKSKINKIKKVDRIKWRGTKWRCGNSFFFCAFKFLNFIFLSRQQHIDNSVHQCHRPD